MEQTDIQFKNDLRKELIMFERFKKLLDEDRNEELHEELAKEIKRINQTLQD